MKLKLTWLMTLFMAFVMQFSFAQEKTVSGTVTSLSDGLPLPGVSIIVKGTTRGVQTDFDGNYSISVRSGETLAFSFVSMKSTEVVVGASNTINVAMEDDIAALDEVVIVGYGTATKQSFVGSAKTVNSENLEVKSFSNVSQALAGEVAGVNVINTSGQPGTAATIRIRGFGSVNGNRDPLYVVDGVPFNGTENINSINPADIKSTTVLKDATATAIYGARGANGVILITTKTGTSGQSAINVDVKTGFNVSLLPRNEVIRNPEQYVGLAWEAKYNKGVALGQSNPEAYANAELFGNSGIAPFYNMWNVANGGELIDPVTRTVRPGVTRRYDPENWEDYGFQTSYRQEANLSFSGGDDKTKYFSSFGYLDEEGYLINSDYKRYSARLNLSHKPKEWLEASANLGYALSETNNNGQSSDSGSIFWFVDNLPSIYPLYLRDANGQRIPDEIFGGSVYDYGSDGRGFGALTNAIADAHYDRSRAKRNELNGNFSFDIKFTKNLSFETRFGFQYYNDKYFSLNNPFYGSAAGQGGSIYRRDTEYFAKNFLQLLRYKNNWGGHSLEVLAAHEANDWTQKRNTASMQGAVQPYVDDLNNFIIVSSPPTSWTRKAVLESYFGQINYDFDQKYFLSGSVRRDGSSRFLPGNKWGTFGSVGASWVLSNENFLQSSSIVSFLKLKASYGLVGEQAGVGLYPGINSYNVGNLNDGFALSNRDYGNPELTWETSTMFQTGLEFTFGKTGFLEGSLDYYRKLTKDLLFDRRNNPSSGIAVTTVNDGELLNSGIEFDLTAHIIRKNDFTLSATLNGEILDNEIKTMPIEPSTGLPKYIDTAPNSFAYSNGHSIFDFYMREWAGVDPADGRAMWYRYFDDANGNGQFDAGEGFDTADNGTGSIVEYLDKNPNANVQRETTKTYADATTKYVGKSAIPKVRGAFRLASTYKNFDLSAQFLYSIGGYAYDSSYANLMQNAQAGANNWHVDMLDRWQQPGDITNVPRLSDNYASDNRYSSLSTRFLTKSDYLALNNIKLGYTLKSNAISAAGIDNVNIWVSGDNMFLFSKRDGFNPSTSESGASNQYRYSPLSTFTMGVRVKF
ncbi:SusC/RagA family TonB-linked outer membrane protein [Gelidibacter sp.]|uniref:SusC/RagA family TonB-linked outer membrane protein n=1 Tax=Gelidibacter sp. TaxID=2018083 RepID=UPI002CFB1AB8|nr:SusC/RagA family TonB-linked outer membrane protein [Gelidibacter sp.]HUH28365.1 SusC/RagA family TonB-linked outer membrane protein [Gelidibacter sp.]